MRPARFLLVVVYMGYLVNAGLLLILLPWSRAWGLLLTRFPTAVASALDAPSIRGALTGFGVLHLLLVAWELINPTLLTPDDHGSTESQERQRP